MARALFFSFIGLVLFFFVALHPQEVLTLIQQFMDSIAKAGDHLQKVQQFHQSPPAATTTTTGG